jgi:DNA-binding CsgD family transcriptional regulator
MRTRKIEGMESLEAAALPVNAGEPATTAPLSAWWKTNSGISGALDHVTVVCQRMFRNPRFRSDVEEATAAALSIAIASGRAPRFPHAWIEKVVRAKAHEVSRLHRHLPVVATAIENTARKGDSGESILDRGSRPVTPSQAFLFEARQQLPSVWQGLRVQLTANQERLCELAFMGLSRRSIARHLATPPQVVGNHFEKLLKKITKIFR